MMDHESFEGDLRRIQMRYVENKIPSIDAVQIEHDFLFLLNRIQQLELDLHLAKQNSRLSGATKPQSFDQPQEY